MFIILGKHNLLLLAPDKLIVSSQMLCYLLFVCIYCVYNMCSLYFTAVLGDLAEIKDYIVQNVVYNMYLLCACKIIQYVIQNFTDYCSVSIHSLFIVTQILWNQEKQCVITYQCVKGYFKVLSVNVH